MKEILSTDKAPPPAGPYSPVVGHGDLLFVSGQGPVDPASGEIVRGTLQEEARRTLDNVRAILEDVGSSMQEALKVTVYLRDMDGFPAFNEVYAAYFPEDPPARTCIQAGRLPMDIQVEIDVIACRRIST